MGSKLSILIFAIWYKTVTILVCRKENMVGLIIFGVD